MSEDYDLCLDCGCENCACGWTNERLVAMLRTAESELKDANEKVRQLVEAGNMLEERIPRDYVDGAWEQEAVDAWEKAKGGK
jgi:hypothetical protein